MSDLLNRIARAQVEAGERVVMEDLKTKGFADLINGSSGVESNQETGVRLSHPPLAEGWAKPVKSPDSQQHARAISVSGSGEENTCGTTRNDSVSPGRLAEKALKLNDPSRGDVRPAASNSAPSAAGVVLGSLPSTHSSEGSLPATVVAVCKCGHSYAQHVKGGVLATYCRHCPCPDWEPDHD